MSTAPVTPAAVTPAPAAAPKGAAEALAVKVQKHVDSLHAKIQRLADENASLKTQLHEAKASNSRIRRIPKKAAAAPAAQE